MRGIRVTWERRRRGKKAVASDEGVVVGHPLENELSADFAIVSIQPLRRSLTIWSELSVSTSFLRWSALVHGFSAAKTGTTID